MGIARLVAIREQLMDAEAAVAKAERTVVEHPDRPSVLFSAKSLEKHRRQLEADFLEEAEFAGLDVCSYRMFQANDHDAPGILAVGSILEHFQQFFSIAFDAVKRGPRSRAVVSRDALRATKLRFGYSFAGSLGVVMTVPKDQQRLLFEEGRGSETVQRMTGLMQADSPETVREASAELGPAVVRAAYQLAEDHVTFDVAANIEWRTGFEVEQETFIQPSAMRRLKKAINATSDELVSEETVVGWLVGVNVERRTFDLRPDRGRTISGKFRDVIQGEETVNVPSKYRATLERRSVVKYSTKTEQPEYFLLGLEPLA